MCWKSKDVFSQDASDPPPDQGEVRWGRLCNKPTQAPDRERTRLISARSYRVIRFWNEDILTNLDLTNLDGVLEQVFAELRQPPPHLPLVRGRDFQHSPSQRTF